MRPPIIIYDGPDACRQCLGWKRVANSDDGESWKFWAELPAPSNIAVSLGLVHPITCPRCQGSGKERSAPGGSEEAAAAGADLDLVVRLTAERDEARLALAWMVAQYLENRGAITHEFMAAQEEAIDILERLGWLRGIGAERYVWTGAHPDGPQPPREAPAAAPGRPRAPRGPPATPAAPLPRRRD